ncbi:MAG: acyl-CoA dehydrogenase [Desulfobacterales bacterium]
MDFALPEDLARERDRFRRFLTRGPFAQALAAWRSAGLLDRRFFAHLGEAGAYAYGWEGGRLVRRGALRECVLFEEFARVAAGAAIAALAHAGLALTALSRFGSPRLQKRYGPAAAAGGTVLCLANTEAHAGSDAAAIRLVAEPESGGFRLSGAKAYVTNGAIADFAVVTAVTDPGAPRKRGLSMFLVDLNAPGVRRRPLAKSAWSPSDLTRLEFDAVRVPADHLLGECGRGLAQVLSVFTASRVPIAAIAVGTAQGAFDLALAHGRRRRAFGVRLLDFQAKAFEAADLHARLEAARMMVWRAAWEADREAESRAAAAAAKYLAVDAARRVTHWAADLFGAASILRNHPIHPFPLDAWAASLGEGTQDVQKWVIFREALGGAGIEEP